MFSSPAVRLNTNQRNENADSVARKPGQSQSLLRKALKDCPVNSVTPIAHKAPHGKVLQAVTSKTPLPKIVLETGFPDWAVDTASNRYVDYEQKAPSDEIFSKVSFLEMLRHSFLKLDSPRPSPPKVEINPFLFEIPKMDEMVNYEPIDLQDPFDRNLNDFAT